ncbi:hypothetical protein M405DRAFT_832986 [Rhizopogon salebrosus TDB-379]|nr:hypothetical protein M405DRAFT_832986 [Rhizopogon salebrosus TDB-379]
MSPSVEPETVAHNILIVSTSLSGLMVLEYAWNIPFEVRVIWPQFRKSAEVKIFVIARYIGLAGQIFNIWFSNKMASGIPSNPLACKAWYSYQAVTTQCLLMSVELLLMLRVCDIYKNHKYIICILFVFAGAQCAAMAISALMILPGQSSSATCFLVVSHPGLIHVGVSTIAINWCILTMILWRCFRDTWPKPRSYLRIMVRDSICTVVAVTGNFLFVVLMPTGVLHSQTCNNILFHVMLFSLWFAAGRLVLHKERFNHDPQNNSELTEVDLDCLEPSELGVGREGLLDWCRKRLFLVAMACRRL